MPHRLPSPACLGKGDLPGAHPGANGRVRERGLEIAPGRPTTELLAVLVRGPPTLIAALARDIEQLAIEPLLVICAAVRQLDDAVTIDQAKLTVRDINHLRLRLAWCRRYARPRPMIFGTHPADGPNARRSTRRPRWGDVPRDDANGSRCRRPNRPYPCGAPTRARHSRRARRGRRLDRVGMAHK